MAVALPEETRQEIYRMHIEENASGIEIAKHLGIGETTVYRELRRRGVKLDIASRYANQRKTTPEQDQEMARLYTEGWTADQLAERYSVNAGTIKFRLKRNNITLRRRGGPFRKFSEEEIARAKTLYAEGYSQSRIGELLGISQTAISKLFERHGVKTDIRIAKGERHGNWQGGRSLVKATGYVVARIYPDNPLYSMANTSGYVMEHRLVMAEALGRPLMEWETVHHINGDKTDNRLKNLQLRVGKHGKNVVYRCADCGSYHVHPVAIAEGAEKD